MSELEDAIVQARRDVWRCIDAYSQGVTQAAELNIHAALARLERLVRLDARLVEHEAIPCRDNGKCKDHEAIKAEIAEAVK